jgi:hypothetical protein
MVSIGPEVAHETMAGRSFLHRAGHALAERGGFNEALDRPVEDALLSVR